MTKRGGVFIHCAHCGNRKWFNKAAANSNTPPKYCRRACQQAAYYQRKADNCDACGLTGKGVRPHGYGLGKICDVCTIFLIKGCLAKVRFDSPTDIQAYVATVLADGAPAHPYRCRFCDGWHWTRTANPEIPEETAGRFRCLLDRVEAGLYVLSERFTRPGWSPDDSGECAV